MIRKPLSTTARDIAVTVAGGLLALWVLSGTVPVLNDSGPDVVTVNPILTPPAIPVPEPTPTP